jgi:hypothetical protein
MHQWEYRVLHLRIDESDTTATTEQTPLERLQTLLDDHSRNGWELQELQPLGGLWMLCLKRRKAIASAELLDADGTELTFSPEQEALWQQVMLRLSRLESRARQESRGGDGGTKERVSIRRRRRQMVLDEATLAGLEAVATLPTIQAAEALGYNSHATLLQYGLRYGYTPGLVKQGRNGKAAIYLGSEKRPHGGSDLRLWRIVEAIHLPQVAVPG